MNIYLAAMRGKQIAFLLLLAAPLFIFFGCATQNRFGRLLNEDAIPQDIRKKGYVLLVQDHRTGMLTGRDHRAIIKFLTNDYKAPFEMVTKASLESGKYADTDKYRYLIKENFKKQMIVTRGASSSTTYTEQVIFDRKENRELPSTGVMAPLFATGMKMFCKYAGKHRAE